MVVSPCAKQVKVFRPDVPVILMTAWGSIQLAVQGMQAGAFDFITKPWNNAALLQRIETALELTAAPKEVPEELQERRMLFLRSISPILQCVLPSGKDSGCH